ncbi:DUF309 domain-containing protein [Bacillus sp. NPDC077027]|uniref:DUF309 domain-containing protein n=1 Tax=Bacillus sp. NPDC077027 TaxID=3390548 RepID=UPI003CFD5EB3
MYPDSYLAFLHEFHTTRDYFECHEILEEYWKEDPPSERKEYWVGFIQLAVALYHQRRGNFRGAKRLISNSLHILAREATVITKLGLDFDKLILLIRALKKKIEAETPYESVLLPINDSSLLTLCHTAAARAGLVFGQNSDLSNTFLLEKHRLRDRSDVLLERQKQIERKQSRDV